ncbi:late embryogenesis abundant protein Lea5 isoform X2 [Ricinus communis]|uniref:Late embryogenesis abundant protein Lea5, putative n=1 Tax=Ricinus communis TaxID=3988 RepID=B9RT73_RICCO|nr:late embryogenesis abundant protein Lea5 isoform X2 [Ricinus communis]EEF45556.1 Late embryogenesis abundant protein Lea5, putative [Ricinus communis]|eukprot:XP_002516942.1 late embryogenesis abundant protein Lea5 isoform X2 [Ricinus communis]
MARSHSYVKLLVDTLSLPIFLRGYSATAHEAASARGGFRSGLVGKVEQRAAIKEDSGACSAWAPDPVTGYYRPANRAAEIDPAELRETLLNHRVRPH